MMNFELATAGINVNKNAQKPKNFMDLDKD